MSNPAIMDDYNERQDGRRKRLEKRAEKLDEQSTEAYEKSIEALPDVPFGQPILVGHHSERRHRRAIERSDAHTRRSIELDRRADECREAAEVVGTGGISTVDPEALDKLHAELSDLEAAHEKRKAVNKIIQKHVPITDPDRAAAEIVSAGLLEAAEARAILGLLDMDKARAILGVDAPPSGCIGYPNYQLRNATAGMRRIKKRIAAIEALRAAPPVVHAGTGWLVRTRNGRIEIHFAASRTPEDMREILKRGAFRWSPRAECWVRKYTINARFAALREIIPAIEKVMQ